MYFLDASSGALRVQVRQEEASVSYQGHHLTDCVDFRVYFDKPTGLAGYCKATLWVSCPDHNVMDITMQIRKINAAGKALARLNYPCPVSESDVPDVPDVNTQPNVEQSLIAPGTRVRLEIPIWPIGMVFEEGEGILLRVAGHDLCLPESEACWLKEPEYANVGRHIMHIRGAFDSSLTIPFILAGE